ncbi:protein OSB2, chloroplastic-like isoform X2 [Cicer arietinum]|uniref:protein OSB2, chloroplastic-like isoform X2 n=1 Tax=Cicer arietinum TaxID=3827 RepID=UPI003CC6BEB2
MALEQAVTSTTFRNLLTFPQSPNSILKSKFQFSTTLPCKQIHRNFKLKFNCSNSITNGTYPKPSEIPWNKDLCNSVNLIGFVANAVEIKHLPSGKAVAWTRLSVKKNATQISWIHLTFWDELAHVAFQHVQKGHQIHVSGRLVTDTVEAGEGKQQTYYKVVAQQLNFIDRSDSPVTSHDQDFDFIMSDSGNGKKSSFAASGNTGSVVELWQTFFANPGEWWDNRNNKLRKRVGCPITRGTPKLLILSTKILEKLCGSKVELIHHGSNPNLKY